MAYYTLTWLEFHPEYDPTGPFDPDRYMVKKSMTFTSKKAVAWTLNDLPKNLGPRFYRFKSLSCH